MNGSAGAGPAAVATGAAERLRSKVTSPAVGTVCFDPVTLKKRLTPLQHHITQDKATERAFSGRFNKHREPGIYRCIVCRQDLFSSATKYDSGSGWPSFYDVIESRRVTLKADLSHVGGNILLLVANPGMERTEVSCARCGAHLGHLFKDGPKPTGHRYCVNSESLDFRRDDSIDVLDKVEFARGGCGELSGSCATPPRPAPRATGTSAAISRVVEKYNSLGGAGGTASTAAAAATSQAVNGQSKTNGERSPSNGTAQVTNGKT